MRPLCLALALALLACLSQSARAETPEERIRSLVLRLPAAEQRFLEGATYAGTYRLGDLVRLWNADGRVQATFQLPDALLKQFPDPTARLIVGIEGSSHLWTIHRSKSGTLDESLSLITLTCYAPDDATAMFSRYALSSDGRGVVVVGSQMYGHPGWQQSLTLGQTDRGLTIAWRLESEKYAAKRASLTGWAQLATHVPGSVSGALQPILARLGASRAASDVYRVFDQIPADPAVVKRLRPLLNALEGESPESREQAMAGIRALGRPGVLACLRRDPSLLSAEQSNRLRALYAADGWVHLDDVEAARTDVAFLTSCLEDEDPRVRSAAQNTLAALAAIQQLKK